MDITVIMECGSDGYYSCFSVEEIPHFSLAGFGETEAEAQEDFLEVYEEMKELEAQLGRTAPELSFTFLPPTQLDTPTPITNMARRLEDISLAISWGNLANRYFKKNSSWLYKKLRAQPLEDDPVRGFETLDALLLKSALLDLADRIRTAAERI